MSVRDNGGPAFPTGTQVEQNGATGETTVHQYLSDGMTLRDYFIAHAPADPWDWFSPSMPAKPTSPPEFPVGNNGERPVDDREANALSQWVNDPVWDADIEHPAFSNWVKAWSSYWDASLEWKIEQKKQTAIQWPAYWADQMIRARST